MTIEEILVRNMEGGDFVQLITNPAILDDTSGIVKTSDPAVLRVIRYLLQVEEGNGKKPYCPFVSVIERGNGYHLRDHDMPPNGFDFELHLEEIDFGTVIGELRKEFLRLSPGETYEGQDIDITTVIASFSHPRCMAPASSLCPVYHRQPF